MDCKGRNNLEIHEAASIEFKQYMIRRLAQEGYDFVDIGIDTTRTTRSPWYVAEHEVFRELESRQATGPAGDE